MQSSDRSLWGQVPTLAAPTMAEALIQAFLSRIPVEHRAKVHERLIQKDKVVFAQRSDVEGQAILDRLYQLRRSE